MKIVLKNVEKQEFSAENITEFIMTETVGAACSCVQLKFKSDCPVGEIVSAKVYHNEKLVFNGFCDNQRLSQCSQGFDISIYARSSAAILVDNEAKPFTYKAPSAKQLCLNNTEQFGFKCCLPEISCNYKYQVTKGTSAYGAVNNFVSLITGIPVYVTPENEIKIYEKSRKEKNLSNYDIISFTAVINRSEPVSKIHYKKETSAFYNIHMESQTAAEIGISRERYLNLSSFPQWQRDYCAAEKLKASFENYKILELQVNGYVSDELYSPFFYSGKSGDFRDYILTEKKYCQSGDSEITKLILKKAIDAKENIYVD